ncbi:hypothetical protein CRUP_003085 [Coryphaenoides rupestris]|nr:hypothetical protein CRUP_003085 [Coryphaenoides rupestris]
MSVQEQVALRCPCVKEDTSYHRTVRLDVISTMSRERTIRVTCGQQARQVVYVVGTTLTLDLCRRPLSITMTTTTSSTTISTTTTSTISSISSSSGQLLCSEDRFEKTHPCPSHLPSADSVILNRTD